MKTKMKKGKSKTTSDSETFDLRVDLYWNHVYLGAPVTGLVERYKISQQSLNQHIKKAALNKRIKQLCELRYSQKQLKDKLENELSFK